MDKCDRKFTSAVNLNVHKNKVHAPKCRHCGNTFDDQKALNDHMRKEHHFVCEECGPDVYFATQKELDNHKRGKRNDGGRHSR